MRRRYFHLYGQLCSLTLYLQSPTLTRICTAIMITGGAAGRWRIYKLEIKYKIKGWGVYVLWELLNVNGDIGWGLGEADLIIFGAEDGVYVVNRAKVTAYICKKLGIQPNIKSIREAESCLFENSPMWKLCHRISRPNERTIKIPFEEFMTFVSPFFLNRYKENENRFRY